MTGKSKNRSAANADSITGGVSCDERILRDCHQLYTDPDSGESADMLRTHGREASLEMPVILTRLIIKPN